MMILPIPIGGFIPIEVTQDDIDRGYRSNPEWCPLVLAACRTFGLQPGLIHVNHNLMNICRYWYRLSPEAKKFVVDFDNLGRTGVSPTTVTISDKGVQWFEA